MILSSCVISVDQQLKHTPTKLMASIFKTHISLYNNLSCEWWLLLIIKVANIVMIIVLKKRLMLYTI